MMKKITLLLILFIGSITMNSQTWDFNNDDGGWTPGASTIAIGPTFLTMTVTDGGNNPTLANLSAGINTANVHWGSVTIRNNHANGPTYLRFSYLKPAGGRVYKNLDITAGDTEFVTYNFDLTNSNWTGTMDDIKLHFKGDGGADYTGTGVETIDIDKIEVLATLPTTEKNSYTFETDDDTEGWNQVNGTIVGVTGGILTFTPTADKFAKMEQLSHYIDADNNSSFHITLINESTNDDELRVIVGAENVTIPISTSDVEEKTYNIDLTGLTDWTGNVDGITIAFRDADNAEGVGKSSGTGNFLIQSIIFDNEAILAVDDIDFKDDVNISLYPNPVNHILSIHSPKVINKVEVFNYLGQRTISKTDSLKTLNISGLTSGVYILKIYQEGNIVSTKRFIKE